MSKSKLLALAIATGCAAAALVAGVLLRGRERNVMEQRLEDVKRLTDAYRSTLDFSNGSAAAAPTNIEGLLTILQTQRVKLHNPIPIDPSKPSYRIVGSPESNILIEETNVTDTSRIVRSTIDGAVFMQWRTNVSAVSRSR